MNFEEISKAARDGRTFRFIGKINELSYENGNLKIDWLFPEVGKPFNRNHDFTYIELAPKHDPCRKFCKGDKVWEVLVNGRRYLGGHNNHKAGELATVTCNEHNSFVKIQYEDGDTFFIDVAYLELVTPVAELELYHINEIYDIDDGKLIGYEVARGDTRDSIFYGGENHLRTIAQAKSAAEDERDRRNAEWRRTHTETKTTFIN